MNALLMAVALAILGMVFALTPSDGGPAIMLMLPLVGIVSLMTSGWIRPKILTESIPERRIG